MIFLLYPPALGSKEELSPTATSFFFYEKRKTKQKESSPRIIFILRGLVLSAPAQLATLKQCSASPLVTCAARR
ncbi:hypothetical protein [Agarivorans gilvus]|uniref:hypothetical protein n=1 Tax=Agarivorans gilvus TaxID=680279 RepID=UPI00166A51AB|nr:hypothetical protein [Agarivorans gilvus]